jgi:hypothetical protein
VSRQRDAAACLLVGFCGTCFGGRSKARQEALGKVDTVQIVEGRRSLRARQTAQRHVESEARHTLALASRVHFGVGHGRGLRRGRDAHLDLVDRHGGRVGLVFAALVLVKQGVDHTAHVARFARERGATGHEPVRAATLVHQHKRTDHIDERTLVEGSQNG